MYEPPAFRAEGANGLPAPHWSRPPASTLEPDPHAAALRPAQPRPVSEHLRGRAALRRLGPIDGLVFDLGDVLYDATEWRRWLLRQLSRVGLHAEYRSFFRLWERDFLDDVHRGARGYADAFAAFLRSAGLSPGQIDEIVAASQVRKRELEAGSRPFPGVRATLERLRSGGLSLAGLSDSESTSARLRERLAQLGLGVLPVVISSFDLQRTKPDPVCYHAALAALGLRADRAAFVGHDAEELAGAAAVGMHPIAFNYDAQAIAVAYIERFDELGQLVEGRIVAALTN
jgi:HAD superfamily hydrolase (TIGR01509 family)